MGSLRLLVGPGFPILGAFHHLRASTDDAYSFTCTSVFAGQTPTDAYRGAGLAESDLCRPSGTGDNALCPPGRRATRPRSGR